MRAFNPERELGKIQRGNKNKIIIGIITILLIIAIGSTYALYQIRYSKRVIYTKVAPFYNKDIIISVKLDDQEKSTDKFPTKEEGYVYSHIECEKDNITNVNWDKENWKLSADINGPDKCTVFFAKSPFNMKSCEGKEMSECLLEEGPKFENILAFDDPNQNGRYIGANPDNYIWFNCADYNNPSEDTCERWRIIGSFRDMEKVVSISEEGITTYEKQNLVKIIRTNLLDKFISWDNKDDTIADGTVGKNDWSTAEIMYLLNEGNEEHTLNNEIANNSLYWNSEEGMCSTWPHMALENCSFKNEGLKNIETKNRIEKVKWYLGGKVGYGFPAVDFYNAERGNQTCYTINNCTIERSLTWDGKVAFIYPSDYIYATSGGSVGREACLKLSSYNWYDSNEKVTSDCAYYSWLLYNKPTGSGWDNRGTPSSLATITPENYNAVRVMRINDVGNTYPIDGVAWPGTLHKPTVYLTHDTKIISGNGTYEKPYVINVN